MLEWLAIEYSKEMWLLLLMSLVSALANRLARKFHLISKFSAISSIYLISFQAK